MSPIVPDKMATFWKDQLLLTDVPSKPGLWNLEENFPLIHKIGRPNPLYKRVDEEELTRIINILS